MKIPRAEIPHLHKPEILEEHENLEKALKAALAITVAAGVYHHAFRSGAIMNIKSNFRVPKGGWNGVYEKIEDKASKFEFNLFIDSSRQLFGRVHLPDGTLDKISEGDVAIEENTGITAQDINEAVESDQTE